MPVKRKCSRWRLLAPRFFFPAHELLQAMPHLRVLTLNAWTHNERLEERTREMVRGIEDLDPAVVCLQEIAMPSVKEAIRQRLSHRYHILGTDCHSISFPLLAYAPVALFGAAAAILLSCLGDAASSLTAIASGTAGAGAMLWLLLLLAGMLLLCPHGIFLLVRLTLARGMSITDAYWCAASATRAVSVQSGCAEYIGDAVRAQPPHFTVTLRSLHSHCRVTVSAASK